MSHVAEVKIQVKDLDCLRIACAKLGLELREGQTQYRWWGQHMGDYPVPDGMTIEDLGHCDHAIAVAGSPLYSQKGNHMGGAGNPAPYEVGVRRRPDGSYSLIYDFMFGGYGLQEKIGRQCKTLVQEYGAQVAIKQAKKAGLKVTGRKTLPNGRIQIICH